MDMMAMLDLFLKLAHSRYIRVWWKVGGGFEVVVVVVVVKK